MALSDRDIYQRLRGAGKHLVANFHGFTPAQRLAIPEILDQKNVLLVAGTASGKTEAVLAPLLTVFTENQWKGKPSILYVAPTRALVNDLHSRLGEKLSGYLSVGRRTGEHHEQGCDLLITTPESLDSMLVRLWEKDGHYLRHARAVVLDELHLLSESARGTQLQILLARLERVTRQHLMRIGLSATVADARSLAIRFLGQDASVQIDSGSRSLEIDGLAPRLDLPPRGQGLDPLAELILRSPEDPQFAARIARRLLKVRDERGVLKALVFVPSRAKCDKLSTELKAFLEQEGAIEVRAHHGSLSREAREDTEHKMASRDEGVVVCTSTLEVGIDIGDVSVVVLVGPPGSVAALLQRIGRGCRRFDHVFVLPIAMNSAEALILASMLRSAVTGDLDPVPWTCHYSVAIQQLASILKQAKKKPKVHRVTDQLTAAFGDHAPWLVQVLTDSSWVIVDSEGGVSPCDALREIMDQPLKLHGNIDASGKLRPVIDGVTGEPLAWVSPAGLPEKVLLGGGSYRLIDRGDSLEAMHTAHDGSGRTARYDSRRAPIGRSALRHLSRGLGFQDHEMISYRGRHYHFGGALFGRLLNLAGHGAGPVWSDEDPRTIRERDFETLTSQHWRDLESFCGFGPFHQLLPDVVRREAVLRTIRMRDIKGWLGDMVSRSSVTPEQAGILDQI